MVSYSSLIDVDLERYNTLYTLKHEIDKLMPAFRGIVYSLAQSSDIVEAIELLGPENLSLLKEQSDAQQRVCLTQYCSPINCSGIGVSLQELREPLEVYNEY